jgi:hypothetical protein
VTHTIISFFKNGDNNITEWNLYCSKDQHEKLVNEFLEHKQRKEKLNERSSNIP